jgi:integrase
MIIMETFLDYSRWPARFAERYGLPRINPHALRHTRASELYKSNVDSVTISSRLGHNCVSTTQDIYYHLLEQADDTVRDAIGEINVLNRSTTNRQKRILCRFSKIRAHLIYGVWISLPV